MALHSEQAVIDGIHIIHAFDVADAAARDALSVTAADVGKVARLATPDAGSAFWVLEDPGGPPGPVGPVVWAPLGGSGSVAVNRQQLYFVGKHGNDANTGLVPDQAFLTFGAAITAAAAMTPSATNRFSVVCHDSGVYSEDVDVLPWINVDAPDVTIEGTVTLHDDTVVRISEVQASGAETAVVRPVAATGDAVFFAHRIALTGAANGILNQGTSSNLHVKVQYLDVDTGFGVGDISTNPGHTDFDIGDITIRGVGGTGIARAGSGEITGYVKHIEETGAAVGSGVAVNVLSGEVELVIGELSATTDYLVGATGALRAFVMKDLGGIKTVTPGGVASISYAGQTPTLSYERPDTNLAPQTVFLNASPLPDEAVTVIDIAGNASVNNITVDGNGNTINGEATQTLVADYASITCVYNGTEWNIT